MQNMSWYSVQSRCFVKIKFVVPFVFVSLLIANCFVVRATPLQYGQSGFAQRVDVRPLAAVYHYRPLCSFTTVYHDNYHSVWWWYTILI